MKTTFAIFTLTLLAVWSCNDNGQSVSTRDNQDLKRDSLTNEVTKKTQKTIALIYESEDIKLYGDTTINKDKISYASIKFEPYIGFDDFKIKVVDHRKYADLDIKSNIIASNYQTRLREGYKVDTANFAGHYTFVYFGCGSPCQGSLVIDRKTGKVYDSPSASLGYDFRVDSRMLIVNPPDTSGFYDDCVYCKPIIYIFDEQTKTFTEKAKKLK